jgi:ADP-ribose pyrophosphatase
MKHLIHQWKKLSLNQQSVLLPNGLTVDHISISHPGACVILPIMEQDQVLLLRQFRPALNDWIFELPAGTMEAGEQPEQCAARELEEETGYSAQRLVSLGHIYPAVGFCDEVQHLFVAQSLRKTMRLDCDEDEVIELHPFSLTTLEQMIVAGKITDAKTIACLLKAKLSGLI